MKRLFFGLLAVASLSLATGCSCVGKCGPGGSCAEGCGPGGCGQGGCGSDLDACHPRMRPLMRCENRHGAGDPYGGGPPSAAIAYPYYTTRGPRDFFEPNPPSIGR
jgi:hypothetical protein